MAGFTPINASVQQGAHAAQLATEQQQSSSATRLQQLSVAASYPGRTETEQDALIVSQPLHGPGTKKATGKGKKRASTSGAAPKAKRRKSSNISDNLSVTKASAHEADGALIAPKATKSKSKRKAAVSGTDHDILDAADTYNPVAVYTPATTVGSLHSTRQPTSLDAVRAGSGYGHTVYDIGRTPTTSIANINVMTPSLSRAVEGKPISSSTRCHRPGVVHSRPVPQIEEDDDTDMIIDSLPTSALQVELAGDRQLPTPVNSDPAPANTRKQPSRISKNVATVQTEEDFLELIDSDDDDAMDELAEAAEDSAVQREPTAPTRTVKQNMRTVDEHEDYGGALLSEAENKLLEELRAGSQVATNKPIVRKPFPPPVLDRSPIFGATNGTVLRICFRIGEALNVGCHAVRTNKNVMLEFYARVTTSWREEKPGRKQHFVFQDLYHEKPPHVDGTFALWDQSQLWELDSNVFLMPRKEGIMCRVIARMKRDGLKWRLEIFNIWEASWEDVDHVAGIYAKDGEASLLTVSE